MFVRGFNGVVKGFIRFAREFFRYCKVADLLVCVVESFLKVPVVSGAAEKMRVPRFHEFRGLHPLEHALLPNAHLAGVLLLRV